MTERHCLVEGCGRPPVCRGWCRTHYARWRRRGGDPAVDVTNQGVPEADRFWMKVERTESCWLWRGGLVHGTYGAFKPGKTPGDRQAVMAHRYAYEQLVGPIPEGLELDHLCRVRQCVNPAHLEPVTPKENTRRGDTIQRRNWLKTECIRGHPFDEANTRHYTNTRGGEARECRACRRDKMRRRRAEMKGLS